MSIEVLHIIELLCREKGIDRDVLVEAVKTAVEAAARKKMPHLETLQSRFNEDTGVVEIFAEKTVVTKVKDPETEVTLKDALKVAPDAQLGEKVMAPQELENLGRIAAQLAKQVIMQRVREAEIEIVYNEFKDKKGELINGIVQRVEHGDIIVELGKAEGILPRREQVFRETFNRGERVRAYMVDVRKTSKNTLVILSRTHVGLIKRLFELEVPEISEGMVEIMGIVREPNGRTKIAVRSNDRDIDAVGACVGMRGMRVQSIVQELRGEKIDIVEYSEDPEMFIRNALSPAKISRIIMDRENRHMNIIVADDQMSLAIGKKGQNVRLAAKLVKWKIDIKGESESVGTEAAHALLSSGGGSQQNFLDLLRDAKGFGEKIVSILANHNVVTLDEVLERGVEGLTELSGIGPKKAESLIEFAQSHAPGEKEAPKTTKQPDQNDSLVYTAPSLVQKDVLAAELGLTSNASAAEDKNKTENQGTTPSGEGTETGSVEGEGSTESEEEDTDPPIEALAGVGQDIIASLRQNGFQTIAELSVTTLDELLALEKMSEDEARHVLELAKAQMENFENA